MAPYELVRERPRLARTYAKRQSKETTELLTRGGDE